MQVDAAIFDQARNVGGGKWLLANPCPEHAEKNPTHARYNGRRSQARSIQQNYSSEHEKNGDKKAASKVRIRSGQP
jgi:hypothetical protein